MAGGVRVGWLWERVCLEMGALSYGGLVGFTLGSWGGGLVGGTLGAWIGGLLGSTLGDWAVGLVRSIWGRTLGGGHWQQRGSLLWTEATLGGGSYSR